MDAPSRDGGEVTQLHILEEPWLGVCSYEPLACWFLQSSERPGLEGVLVPRQPWEGFVAAAVYTFGCAHPARRAGWDYVPGAPGPGCLPG